MRQSELAIGCTKPFGKVLTQSKVVIAIQEVERARRTLLYFGAKPYTKLSVLSVNVLAGVKHLLLAT